MPTEPPEGALNEQPALLTLPALSHAMALLGERIVTGPLIDTLRRKFHGRLVEVAAFEVNNEPSFSPFSPLIFSRDDLEQLKTRLEGVTGCIVIPELLLEQLLESRTVVDTNTIRYDLNKEDDRAALADPQTVNDIRAGLFNGSYLIIIEHIDALQSEEIDTRVRYRVEHQLRSIEDSLYGDSLLVATVTAGERLPVFTTMTHSPAFLSSSKIGFSQDLQWQPTDLGDQKPTNMKKLSDLPRRDLTEIFGVERRELTAQIIEEVKAGHNVLVTGTRRGGKTSTIATVRNELRSEQDIVFEGTHLGDTFIKNSIIRNLLVFKDDEAQTAAVAEISACELINVPNLLNRLVQNGVCQWSGKKLVLFEDETIESSMNLITDGGREVVNFFRFIKFAKEAAIPVSTLQATIGWYWPQLMKLLRESPDNVEQAELSAFTVHHLKPFSDDEARALLENLLSRINRKFPTERDRELFIVDMIEQCSGLVACLNIAVDIFESTGDRAKIVSQIYIMLKEVHMALTKIQLSPEQRHIISRLCWAQNAEITLSEPGLYLDDIVEMERSGYISYHFEDDERTRVRIKLLNPQGFRIAMEHLHKLKLVSVTGDTTSAVQEQEFWSAARAGHVDINDVVPKPQFHGGL